LKIINQQLTKVTKLKSFRGYEFDIGSDFWQLDKNTSLNLDFIRMFDLRIQSDLRETLAYFAETKSPYHSENMRKAIKSYLDKTQTNLINEHGLLKYKSIYSKKSEEYRLGTLRVFLKQIYFLEYKAVSEEIFSLLDGWRLSGNDKGTAVLSIDPEEGQYSDIEFEAIKFGLDNKFAESIINAEEYCLAQIFACTGRRPIQIASIKVGDFYLDNKTLDTPTFVINVPRAKVRGGGFRESFKVVAIAEYVGQVITQHIDNLRLKLERILGKEKADKYLKLLPLFPDNLRQLKNISEEKLALVLNSDLMHLKTSDLRFKLVNVIDKLNIISERTGKRLKTTGYRFRYTIGTRAARNRAGVLTIANLLDHSDTQNTKVYVANIPEHAATISAVMNGSLMRYANAFLGKVVESEEEVFKELPNAPRIRTHDSKANVGSCGTCSDCNQYKPIACYICPKFRPWRDAPHHLILSWLIDERERIKNLTEDLEIAAINDRTIIAVNQVINACENLKNNPEYD
jgi:integrase